MGGEADEFSLALHRGSWHFRSGAWVRLVVSDDRIEIRSRWPSWVPTGLGPTGAVRAAADDIQVVLADGPLRGGLEFVTASGVMDGLFITSFGWSARRAVKESLERHGYDVR